MYDSLVDTLALSLLGNVTVTAHFIPPTEYKNVVYQVIPTGTTTTIDANGTVLNAFPTTETYVLGDTIALTPTIDPLYYFSHWEADSSIIIPTQMKNKLVSMQIILIPFACTLLLNQLLLLLLEEGIQFVLMSTH